ncbi:hypothetical protein [Dactylosporangium sp. NPDC005555]|uniref:hypothetical protein n=1 Tax=Dactylosporangium sp. NPDC005555 TaxID=3154889 RepID=UPI0033BAFCD1
MATAAPSGTAPDTTTIRSAKSTAGRRTTQRSASSGGRIAQLDEFQADVDARLAGMASDPRQWVEFVEQVAAFGARYSAQNQLLLQIQATQRGITPRFFLPYGGKDGTTGWLGQGRQVRRGEQAFRVCAPILRRPTEQQAAELAAAGRPVLRDAAGRPVKQVVGFRGESTFELSQTDGAPFEPPTVARTRRRFVIGGRVPQPLTGDDPTGVLPDLVALIESAGYAFEFVPPGTGYLGDADGVTVFTGSADAGGVRLVQVRADGSAAQRVAATARELARIRCGHVTAPLSDERLHRGRAETEAESVAHVVCAALGFDTRDSSDAYVLGWADGDMDVVRSCADTVRRVSRSILLDLTPEEPADDNTEAPEVAEVAAVGVTA